MMGIDKLLVGIVLLIWVKQRSKTIDESLGEDACGRKLVVIQNVLWWGAISALSISLIYTLIGYWQVL
jgi:hypothetical protein